MPDDTESADDLLSQEESDQVEEPCCKGFLYSCLNKFLKYYSYAFGFVAWMGWYYQFLNGDPNEEWTLQSLLLFYGVILLILFVIFLVHYSYAHDLEKNKEKLMKSDATPADVGGALVEESYEQFTEAIGYILVEVFLKVYRVKEGHPYLSTLVRFSATIIVVLLFETCERKMKPGRPKAFFHLLSECIMCGGMWFTVTSATLAWRTLFGVEEVEGDPASKDPGALVCFVAFTTGVVASSLVSYITAKTCHGDGEADEDTAATKKLCGEKILTLVKKVGLFAAGYLYLDHDNQFEEASKSGLWVLCLCLFVYSIFGVLTMQLVEQCCIWGNGLGGGARTVMPAGQRAYWLRFQHDFVSSCINTQSFVFAMLVCDEVTKKHYIIDYWFTAVLAQIVTVAIEFCRVQRLKREMSELHINEDFGSDSEHSEHSASSQ